MIARHTYAKVALPATVDVTPPEPLVITKAATTVDDDPKRSVESNTALIQRDMKYLWTVSGN